MTIIMFLLGAFLIFRLIGMAQARAERANNPQKKVLTERYFRFGRRAREIAKEEAALRAAAQFERDLELGAWNAKLEVYKEEFDFTDQVEAVKRQNESLKEKAWRTMREQLGPNSPHRHGTQP